MEKKKKLILLYIVLVGMGLLSSLEGGCRHFFCTRMNYADVLVL